MDDFQKIIVQMLKVQMDHQQKSDERQQTMEEQWVQQLKELQQQKWGKTPTSINEKWEMTEPNGRVTIKTVKLH